MAAQRHITAGRHPRRFLPGVLAEADQAYELLDASLEPYLRASQQFRERSDGQD